MTAECRWLRRSEGIAARRIEGEVVVLDITTRQYHALNASAAILWEVLAEDTPHADLVAALTGAYDVESQVAASDVAAFLDRMLALDLVRKVR